MSTLKVDTILKRTGTGTITLGQSGDTISVPTGASLSLQGGTNGQALTTDGSGTLSFATVGGNNQPYFFVGLSDTVSYSDATTTQVNFNSEIIDEGSCYNNTGSSVTLNGISVPAYSFGPNVAGKYYISTTMQCYSSAGQLGNAIVMLFKNSSQFAGASMNHSGSGPFVETIQVEGIVNLNGTGDYVQAKVYMDVGSGTPQLLAGNTRNMFQGFKLI
tara:strand:+ start:824 stop:1474 length:651 start_codon:yes stop_codon:yes gene_type:complete